MTIVTVYGSCRQHSIKNTTCILEELTYPHYSSEILQAIRYCKYNNISPENTQHCFRTGLLCKRSVNYHNIKSAFDCTDIFIIEIASRKSYMWNNLFMHHIAIEDAYNFYDRKNVQVKRETDEEIEQNLIDIRKELHPKPFIVISHITTYNHGERYELTKLLEKLTDKMDIPFLNPTILLNKFPVESIMTIEPTNVHYNQNGHAIISSYYERLINDTINNMNKKTLYQVYYTSAERVSKHTTHGLGDYIRGCTYLYQICKENNVQLKIDFSQHALSNVVYCKTHKSLDEMNTVRYFWDRNPPVNFNMDVNVFTNSFPIFPVTDECKKFIVDNCLCPRLNMQEKIKTLKKSLQLEQYSVIHIRLGDTPVENNSVPAHFYNNIIVILQKLPTDKNYLLMSDSNVLIDKLCVEFPFKKTSLSRTHVGNYVGSNEQVCDTMCEFFLMTTCEKIIQLSAYSWGSGFSNIVHDLYHIPITKICI